MNAGQICLAPDYVMVHSDKKDELVAEMKSAVTSFYPDLKHNDDYTSIINEKHYDRLQGLLRMLKKRVQLLMRLILPMKIFLSKKPSKFRLHL